MEKHGLCMLLVLVLLHIIYVDSYSLRNFLDVLDDRKATKDLIAKDAHRHRAVTEERNHASQHTAADMEDTFPIYRDKISSTLQQNILHKKHMELMALRDQQVGIGAQRNTGAAEAAGAKHQRLWVPDKRHGSTSNKLHSTRKTLHVCSIPRQLYGEWMIPDSTFGSELTIAADSGITFYSSDHVPIHLDCIQHDTRSNVYLLQTHLRGSLGINHLSFCARIDGTTATHQSQLHIHSSFDLGPFQCCEEFPTIENSCTTEAQHTAVLVPAL